MKFLSLFFFLATIQAQAANWVEVQLDHPNFQYSTGEKAKFFLREVASPSNPAFRLQTTLEHVNHFPAFEIPFTNGVGNYESAALPGGEESFRIVTRLVSVPAGSYNQILEDRVFVLTVLTNP